MMPTTDGRKPSPITRRKDNLLFLTDDKRVSLDRRRSNSALSIANCMQGLNASLSSLGGVSIFSISSKVIMLGRGEESSSRRLTTLIRC